MMESRFCSSRPLQASLFTLFGVPVFQAEPRSGWDATSSAKPKATNARGEERPGAAIPWSDEPEAK